MDDPESGTSVGESLIEPSRDRIESRTATVFTDIGWLNKNHRWPGLMAVGKVVRRRDTAEKTTTETAYYVMSAALSAQRLNRIARQHWEVENSFHWKLDVVMNEDQDRTRRGNGPHNLAVLRHMVLNAMQKIQGQRLTARKVQKRCLEQQLPQSLLALFRNAIALHRNSVIA